MRRCILEGKQADGSSVSCLKKIPLEYNTRAFSIEYLKVLFRWPGDMINDSELTPVHTCCPFKGTTVFFRNECGISVLGHQLHSV